MGLRSLPKPMPKTVYTLELEGGNYYVGTTERDVSERFAEHVAGCGATWTGIHPPVRVLETREVVDSFEEDRMTLQYMATHGIHRVRGGSFVSETITPSEEQLIRKMIATNFSLCFRCQKAGHFAHECPGVATPVPFPDVSKQNSSIVSHDVNLYEALKDPKIDTLILNSKDHPYLRQRESRIIPSSKYSRLERYYDVRLPPSTWTFCAITGLARVKNLVLQEGYCDGIYDLTNLVNLEKVYINMVHRQIDDDVNNAVHQGFAVVRCPKSTVTMEQMDPQTTIIKARITDGMYRPAERDPEKEKRYGMRMTTPPEYRSNVITPTTRDHLLTIISHKKIETHVVGDAECDAFIKMCLLAS